MKNGPLMRAIRCLTPVIEPTAHNCVDADIILNQLPGLD
jgi:hypothetical protein